MCCVMVILLATRVHGLVHVVDPGLVRAGGHARTAAAALTPAVAPTPRAPEGGLAAVLAHDHAPGIEMLSEYIYFSYYF